MGLLGFHFSRTTMVSLKRVSKSGGMVFTVPFWSMTSNRSSPLNSPSSSPLPSTFNRLTISSNQIFLGLRVDTPFSFSSIRLTGYLVTKLPLDALPLMSTSAKSRSHFNFFILPDWRSNTVTTSASPLGFAEKYNTSDEAFSPAKGYILSRVMLVTLNLLM